MPERIARVDQEYAGRPIKVGQAFDVESGHIELLSALGRIEPEEGDPKPGWCTKRSATYKTRALMAQPPVVPSIGKRAYNRKAT